MQESGSHISRGSGRLNGLLVLKRPTSIPSNLNPSPSEPSKPSNDLTEDKPQPLAEQPKSSSPIQKTESLRVKRAKKIQKATFTEWYEVLIATPPEEQVTFIYNTLAGKDMLHIFGRFFFPHIVQGIEETPECHLDLISELSRRENGAIIFPRGFAKSTWEKIDTIHDIVYALEPVILYCSVSLGAAGLHFESIKSELENNYNLREVYGDLVPSPQIKSRKWTNTHIETTNGVNLVARGASKGRGVNIKNRRPTKCIFDDIEEDEQVASEMRREKLARWVYRVILPSMNRKRGFVKFIGTVIHPQCEVLKFYNGHGGIFRKAIENGESIWPEMYPVEKLLEIRDGYTDENGKRIVGIGSLAFEQEYQNNPIDTETAMFREEWVNGNQYQELPDIVQAFDFVMAVDPNSGESKKADRMGICVMAKHRATNLRYVVHAKHYSGLTISKRLEMYKTIYFKWNPLRMGIEVVMNQRADYQLACDTKDFRVVELSPKSKSKEDRAKYVQPIMEQGIIKFHPGQIELYEEIVHFPGGEHDDLFDAFMYANEMLDEMTTERISTKRTKSIAGNVRSKLY